ncbi:MULTISPECIES: diguanylate cyclase domain-containing protein [Fervidobacterium]|uniref:Putative diguanylate cyclase n=1 Tax=Fervidobacterium nodosum (strain ATCC 35602 / DSM 5306 / Rt17-B1) TaxID=381764 RepID=A7HJX4_FERNB|nr:MULTISPECIES: diguanylate cyclase [Fervidobacterium]ABS60207.1 putative diguanylate cyclase [Fervidobacterium nodosum Rt17-B1]KAF2961506.1 diguanylate cyclase [Fervidobacterium sp. 2310opik-2]HOJ93958.1 diguanylate cyclase [Fervidobacterium nodosum]
MPEIYNLLNGKWIDTITRLPNKEFAEKVFEEIKNSSDTFYVLKLIIDFPASNENVTAFVLSRISSVIKHSVRIPKDFVCKLDGNDFCIVVHGITESEVQKIAIRIKDSLHYLLLTYGNEKIQINCQIEIETIGGGI